MTEDIIKKPPEGIITTRKDGGQRESRTGQPGETQQIPNERKRTTSTKKSLDDGVISVTSGMNGMALKTSTSSSSLPRSVTSSRTSLPSRPQTAIIEKQSSFTTIYTSSTSTKSKKSPTKSTPLQRRTKLSTLPSTKPRPDQIQRLAIRAQFLAMNEILKIIEWEKYQLFKQGKVMGGGGGGGSLSSEDRLGV